MIDDTMAARSDVRHLASLLGVSPRAVLHSVAASCAARKAAESGAVKLGLATVNGVTKLVPQTGEKVRLTLESIRQIWGIGANERIVIG